MGFDAAKIAVGKACLHVATHGQFDRKQAMISLMLSGITCCSHQQHAVESVVV